MCRPLFAAWRVAGVFEVRKMRRIMCRLVEARRSYDLVMVRRGGMECC